MRKRLYILAPNDRFNYGDLLFPYIIVKYLGNNFDDIVYCSTSDSDLSDRGGIKTVGFQNLYNIDLDFDNYLIVAGGESLCSSWMNILSFINPKVMKYKKCIHRFSRFTSIPIVKSLIDFFLKKEFNIQTEYPFSVGSNELPNFISIVYNSLGGVNLLYSQELEKQKTQQILKSVDYIAVRDDDTHKALLKAGITHYVAPDSAILISEVFSREALERMISDSVRSFVRKEQYMFFQVGLKYAQNNIQEIVSQLRYIYLKSKLKICLCPIGMALGHSDQIALSYIAKALYEESYFIVKEPNIFDIMYLISNSEVYVGSSLHGTITAMSFNVPFCSFGARKINSYMNLWMSDEDKFGIFSEISDLSLNVMNLIGMKCDENSKQKEEIIKSFQRIEDIWSNM